MPMAEQTPSSQPHQRTCIVTGQKADKSDLIRFVCHPEGGIIADLGQKLPGRGAWVVPNAEALTKAVTSGRMTHHLSSGQLDVQDVLSRTVSQLDSQLLASLTLLRRAGLVVLGRAKIAGHEMIDGLLIADDASERESRALISEVQPDWIEKDIPASVLGRAGGRDSLAYAGISSPHAPGQDNLVRRLQADIRNWRGFRHQM